MLDAGYAVRNDILGSGNVARVKANVVVHHHGTLETTKCSAYERTVASFFHPRLSCSVVSLESHHRQRVQMIWIVLVVMVRGCVVDNYGRIFEDIYTDEVAVLVVADIY